MIVINATTDKTRALKKFLNDISSLFPNLPTTFSNRLGQSSLQTFDIPPELAFIGHTFTVIASNDTQTAAPTSIKLLTQLNEINELAEKTGCQ